ncbi:MAG TPA: DinB family protein [Thermoanaerobaculia bacterium]|jgi:uncharacterized damage-inducible protein DinB|nr:DinB family protein [Thermoanaerobaculia bacterium]
MSTVEFFAKCLAAEIPTFARVIRALPGDQLDYRPHERSTDARMLAWQLAYEMKDLAEVFEKGSATYIPGSAAPQTLDEIASAFDRNAERALGAVNAGEARWGEPAKFSVGNDVVWEAPISEMAWGFLFDLIHHRGQLSAYIRPMGGKVPSIYGPSGDER